MCIRARTYVIRPGSNRDIGDMNGIWGLDKFDMGIYHSG